MAGLLLKSPKKAVLQKRLTFMRGRPVKQKRGKPQCCFVVVAHIFRALLYVGMGVRVTIDFAAEVEEEEEDGETAAEWVTRVKQKKIG